MIYNLGRVVPIFKGDYNSATTYTFLDVVFYDNSSFVALDTTTGNLPTDTTHWLPVALKGITQNPTPAQMQEIISTVETYITSHTIVDNLNSTNTDKSLSANQGKELKSLISDVAVITNLSDDDDVYTDFSIIKPKTGLRFSSNNSIVLDKSKGYTNKFYTNKVNLLDTTNFSYQIFEYDNGTPNLISSSFNTLRLIRITISKINGEPITSDEILNSFTFNTDFTKDVVDAINFKTKYSNNIYYISESIIYNGKYQYLANRVCTTPIYNVDKISIASGYRFGYAIINEDGTIGATGTTWYTNELTLGNKAVIINISKSDNSAITKTEAANALTITKTKEDYIVKKKVVINSHNYFERGGFNQNGKSIYITTRIRTISPIISNSIKVNVASGSNYVYSVFAFNNQNTLISYTTTFQTTSNTYSVSNAAYYFVVVANSNTSTDITPSEFDTSGITIEYYTENPPDTKYLGKKLSVLGDSISTFGTPNQSNALGMWCYAGNLCRYPQNDLFTDIRYQYWHKLMEKYTIQYGMNDSIRGSMVSWDGHTETSVVGADKHIASLTRIQHLGLNGTPDYIVVYAGTNDAGNNVPIGTFNTENPMNYTEEQIAALPVDTFANAYRTMLIRLQYYYPTSKILLLLPNYITRQYYYTVDTLDEYIEMIKEIADYFGVKYVDLRTSGITIFNATNYLPDDVHPNAEGMNILFDNIDNAFKTL